MKSVTFYDWHNSGCKRDLKGADGYGKNKIGIFLRFSLELKVKFILIEKYNG